MPNSIFIISFDYASFNDWPADTAKHIYPSVLIEQKNQQQITGAYKYCGNNKVNDFSISILVNTSLSGRFAEEVISFLFIPGYYAINNKRIINLIGTDKELLTKTEKAILEFSRQQGIENLAINCPLPYEQIDGFKNDHNTNYFFTGTETLLKHYHSIINSGNLHNSGLFLFEPQFSMQELNSKILEAEEEAKNGNPLLYNAMSALDKQATENELIKRKMLAAETELNNYKSHIEALKSSHEARELQKYYDGEYEALPLWYKRLGHVIKVITGNRSFRSLFNNKIKKAKD